MRYIVFFLLFSSLLHAQQEQWTVYTTENSSLPSNQINALALQDSIVWAGTPLGLARFDGAQWAVYNTVNSPLPGNYIKCLFAPTPTTLWIGSTGGATYHTADQWTSYSSSNSALPSNDIRALAQWNGAMWFATSGGLASFDGTEWKTYTTQNSALPSNNLLALSVGNGVLWIGTDGAGLVRFNGSTWTTYNTTNSPLPLNTILSLAFVGGDELYVGTWDSKGLAIVRTSAMTWRVVTPQDGLPDGSIRSLAAAQCGYAWVGTRLGGLTDNRSAFQTRYTSQLSGLPNNYVLSLAPYREDIWVGTEQGLAFLNKIKRIHVATAQSLCQAEQTTLSFAVDGIDPCSGAFTVQLSDASGNFDTPVSLVSASAVYPFVLPITIPPTTEPSPSYRVRVTLDNTEILGTSASFAIHPLPKPTISQQQVIHLCGSDSITFDAGDFASYRWSTGSAERTLTVKEAGTYHVTVTNTQGCTAQSPSVRVETHERPQPTITAFGTVPMCIGDTVLIATEQYDHYQWSNGATTQTIAVTQGGVYNVTVSDAFGCSAHSTSIEISTYPQPPTPSISNINNTLYSSPALGYQWARNGTDIPDATDRVYKPLKSGSYTVTIRDENFCRSTSTPYSLTIVDVEEYNSSTTPHVAVRYNREDDTYVLTGTLVTPTATRIAVLDVLGRTVYTTHTEPHEQLHIVLPLHYAPTGLYFVEVQTNEQRMILNLLKQ